MGLNVGLYMDTPHEIEIGDFIRTRTGRTYCVTSVRQQQRGAHTGRWHLRVDVVPPDLPTETDVVHALWWYSRG